MSEAEPLASLAALHAALAAVREDRFRLATGVAPEAHDRFTASLIEFALAHLEVRKGRAMAMAQARSIVAAWGARQ